MDLAIYFLRRWNRSADAQHFKTNFRKQGNRIIRLLLFVQLRVCSDLDAFIQVVFRANLKFIQYVFYFQWDAQPLSLGLDGPIPKRSQISSIEPKE